jgi:hypothetical protein
VAAARGSTSALRGHIASVAMPASNANWSTKATRVDTPGIADLMKIGTIYRT